LILEKTGVADFICERLNLECGSPDLSEWSRMVEHIKNPKPPITVGVVGKYVDLEDAYISVYEALHHAATQQDCEVNIEWIASEDFERGRGLDRLEKVNGIVVPGGFGERGIEGKVIAAKFARVRQVPYLGLCLGMQVMVIELARDVFESDAPNSTEFNPTTLYPVIDLMPDQRDIADLGGTMRLGSYPCRLVPGTIAAAAYGVEVVTERHRHRFELNNEYRQVLQQAGLVLCGLSPDGRLVVIAEIKDHPFMLGSHLHPEFKSRPTRPHPLFTAFIKAARDHAGLSEDQTAPLLTAPVAGQANHK
jgi:CTP synthase